MACTEFRGTCPAGTGGQTLWEERKISLIGSGWNFAVSRPRHRTPRIPPSCQPLAIGHEIVNEQPNQLPVPGRLDDVRVRKGLSGEREHSARIKENIFTAAALDQYTTKRNMDLMVQRTLNIPC